MHYAAPPASLRPPSPSRGERCWLLATGLLTLPFLVYLFVVARRAHISARFVVPRSKGFGLIIDAGPAGSWIHVFEFLNEGRIPFIGLDGKGSVSMKVRPGLQEFAAKPERARGSLDGLLERGVRSMGSWSSPGKGEFARERIPKAEWKATTKIILIDSGAVRGLKVEGSCKRLEGGGEQRHHGFLPAGALTASGFMFRDEWTSIWLSLVVSFNLPLCIIKCLNAMSFVSKCGSNW